MLENYKNIYNTFFKVFEFKNFIIITTPKGGTNFFHSLARTNPCRVHSISFNSMTECKFGKDDSIHNQHTEITDRWPELELDFFRFPKKHDITTQQTTESKKIYCIYRDPWKKLISSLSQDYFKQYLDISQFGYIQDGQLIPNQFLEMELQFHEKYPQSIYQKDYIKDALMEGINHFKDFKEFDDYFLSWMLDYNLNKMDLSQIDSNHNRPYLHILFLLKLNYIHLNFIDLDSTNILEFLINTHNITPPSEKDISYYKNDDYLKNKMNRFIKDDGYLNRKFNDRLTYHFYFYNFLKTDNYSNLFSAKELTIKLTKNLE